MEQIRGFPSPIPHPKKKFPDFFTKNSREFSIELQLLIHQTPKKHFTFHNSNQFSAAAGG
jgi:hypothetical protein